MIYLIGWPLGIPIRAINLISKYSFENISHVYHYSLHHQKIFFFLPQQSWWLSFLQLSLLFLVFSWIFLPSFDYIYYHSVDFFMFKKMPFLSGQNLFAYGRISCRTRSWKSYHTVRNVPQEHSFYEKCIYYNLFNFYSLIFYLILYVVYVF